VRTYEKQKDQRVKRAGSNLELQGSPKGIAKGNPMNLYLRLDIFSEPGNDIIIQKYAS